MTGTGCVARADDEEAIKQGAVLAAGLALTFTSLSGAGTDFFGGAKSLGIHPPYSSARYLPRPMGSQPVSYHGGSRIVDGW